MALPSYGAATAESAPDYGDVEAGLLASKTVTSENPSEPSAPPMASVVDSLMNNNNNNDENDEKMCRICLDTGNEDDMIAPCLCAGGSKWVHRQCLDGFRAANENNYKAISQCMSCNFEYSWVPSDRTTGCCGWINEPKWELRRRILRDASAVVFLWIAAVCGIGGIVFVAVKDISFARACGYAFIGLCCFFGIIALFHGCISACANDECIDPCPHGCICIGPIVCDDCKCNKLDEGCLAVVLVLLIVLVFIGFAYLVFISAVVVAMQARKHYQRYEREMTCQVYIVQDLRELNADQKRDISGQSYERQPLIAGSK